MSWKFRNLRLRSAGRKDEDHHTCTSVLADSYWVMSDVEGKVAPVMTQLILGRWRKEESLATMPQGCNSAPVPTVCFSVMCGK